MKEVASLHLSCTISATKPKYRFDKFVYSSHKLYIYFVHLYKKMQVNLTYFDVVIFQF